MTISVGIDTGGTFTDAVVMVARDGAQHLVTKAKAPTTHEDLSIGISEALAAAMDSANLAGPDVGLVSLSTTLATNALVEGRGGSVALIAVGFSPRDMERAGLAETPGLAKVVVLPGGHTTHGSQAEPLDLTALAETSFDDVDGVAVAGLFATRNPAHEIAVRDAVMKRTGLPVTCSHELSARLNGPKRALTTVLNARLVPLIGALLDAAEGVLSARSIVAPLMVVRGNGALVRADFARTRPIETILSGPAASLVGARHLTGLDAAVVNDIGGTTSDVAVLRGGMPVIDPDGARVGAHRTMVEAVAMRTFGLGGDSAVTLQTEGLATRIQLGPRRHVPIAKLLSDHPTLHEALEGQLRSTLRGRHDGAFAWRRAGSTTGIDAQAMKLLERFEDQPLPLRDVLEGNAQAAALDRLVARGLLTVASITPTDASHVLGSHAPWDVEGARKALTLAARRKGADGKVIAADAESLATRIVIAVERRSAEVVLETALVDQGGTPADVDNPLYQRMLDGKTDDLVQARVTLALPVIGLGASAGLYHPAIGERMGTEIVVPQDADVANAIGAVVGQVMQKAERTITQPAEGRFAVSGDATVYDEENAAISAAEVSVSADVAALMERAGASDFETRVSNSTKRATIEGREMLVECRVVATATGRPATAS